MENKKDVLTPVVAFTKTLGLKLVKKDTFTLHAPNKDGKLVVKIDNAQIAESANALEMLVNASNKSTKAICATLAYIEKLGAHAQFGFKTVADFGESLTGLDRKTVLTYIQVGRAFFNDFTPVKDFVNELSVGHLNQMRAMATDCCYVYGAKTDLGFFQALFDSMKEKDGTVPTVACLNKVLSNIRSNFIDVRYLNDTKTAFLVDDKKERFPNYIELNELNDDDEGDTAATTAKDSGESKEGRAAAGIAGKEAASAGGSELTPLDKAITSLTDSLHFFTARYADDEELGRLVLALQSHIAEKLHAEETSTESN